MTWISPFQRRAGPHRPDKEDISLDVAIERAYRLAVYSLCDEEGYVAKDIAKDVAYALYLKWRQDASAPPEEVAPREEEAPRLKKAKKRNHIPTNRGFDIDLTAFDALEPRKIEWIDAPERPLDTETVDCWVIEDTVNYALKRHSVYVGVAVGNVLFSYENTKVQSVVEKLNRELLETEAQHKDADFRDAKGFTLAHYFKQKRNGEFRRSVGRFLQTEPRPTRNNEVRFKSRPNSADSFEFVAQTLEHLTPLQPDCPFPHEFYDGNFNLFEKDLEVYVRKHDVYKTPDGTERVRMHVLLHPECWFRIFEKMEMESPKMKLEMPDYSSSPRVNPSARPPAKRGRKSLSTKKLQKEVREIRWRVRQLVEKHKNFSARSVKLIVNNEESFEFDLERPRTLVGALKLDEGDNIIKIRGCDGTDSLLLGMHILPWGRYQVGDRPVRYVTELDGGRRLEFLIKYNKDESGEPVSAEVDVTYALEEQRRVAFLPPWTRKLADLLTPAYATGAAMTFCAAFASALFMGSVARKLSRRPPPFAVAACRVLLLAFLLLPLWYIFSSSSAPDEKRESLKAFSQPAANTGSGAVNQRPSGQTSGVLAPSLALRITNANSHEPIPAEQRNNSREHKPAPAPVEETTNKSSSAPAQSGPAEVTLSTHSPSVIPDVRATFNSAATPKSHTSRGNALARRRHRSGLRSAGSLSAGRRGGAAYKSHASQQPPPSATVKSNGTAAGLYHPSKLLITVTDTENKSLPLTVIEFRALDRRKDPLAALSNDKGKARFCEINSGIYDYTAEKPGFQPAKGRLLIRESTVNEYTITLKPRRGRGKADIISGAVIARRDSLHGCQPAQEARAEFKPGRAPVSSHASGIRQRPGRQ